MNQNQIQQLTLHLSQALDQNYDVVNMEAVLSVICALEGTTITKDQLEATRLAKYINQLRRRTKNEQLARRAKSLLKKWREMVGIQQTNDSQPQQQQLQLQSQTPSSQQRSKSDNDVVDTSSIHQYSMLPSSSQQYTPTQYDISDSHSNIDSSQNQQLQTTTFPSLLSHMESDDTMVNHFGKTAIKHKPQKTSTFINELSSSSVSNLATAPNDQLNQASIVIDIVSDSDDNDHNNDNAGTQAVQKFGSSSSSLALPAMQYPRPKKVKKDKRRKEKIQNSLFSLKEGSSQQQSKSVYKSLTDTNCFPVKDGKAPSAYPTDSEILSLSNSSMSSILSGDPLSGNSQSKQRTSDLSFAGRFKSVSQADTSNVDISAVLTNGVKTVSRINEKSNADQPLPIRQMYEEYINNDSSTSCSRLSPFEELEAKQSQGQNHSQSQSHHSKSFVEPNKQQVPRHLKSNDSHSSEYHESLVSQVPKKRGRKKGSKGVDSVIAKESRLSQQIQFGSGVKKVKTTKELFNEIQGRKMSNSFNRSEAFSTSNNLSSSSIHRSRESRSSIPRPTSSCSETSIHSPQISEAYSSNMALSGIESKFSNNLEDTGNTDSDTITSEPSRDSIKSGERKRTPSLDSISNSFQTCSVKNAISMSTAMHNTDVTTQLMHLVNSLSSPLSVNDAEQLYQSQIVPCTCVVLEETQNGAGGHSELGDRLDNDTGGDLSKVKSNDERDPSQRDSQIDEHAKSLNNNKSTAEEAALSLPRKPKKSIFDLDFDEDEDPLHAIIKSKSPSESSSNPQRVISNDNDNDSKFVPSIDANNLDLQASVGDNPDDKDDENADKVPVTLSIYTVHEDPNCVAKQRFTVQTNNVTNYHINALHNYYVPNINGNWNSIETPLITESSVSVFLKELDSYEVSDGGDVVPTYGSLTYDRIPKDLSFLKFANHCERKFKKSFIPPFLGVAKCLPSCRLAKKKASALSGVIFKSEPETNTAAVTEDSSPLRVDVYGHDNVDSNENQMPDNTNLSCNLLQMVNNSGNAPTWPIEDDHHSSRSRRSSSSSLCSNSSLKITQNSINEKLRHQRAHIERNVVERNRKKRRKSSKVTENLDGTAAKPRIKRIKIAINGNVATQRQISLVSSDDDDDDEKHVEDSDQSDIDNTSYLRSDAASNVVTAATTTPSGSGVAAAASEDDEQESLESRSQSTTIDGDEDKHMEIENDIENDNENEYDNSNSNEEEEYAIVQRPLMGGSNNHIVLTIKKTPSKINSPVNSMSATSPIVSHSSIEAETAKYINFNNVNNNNCNSNNDNNNVNSSTVSEMITAYQNQHQFYKLSLEAISSCGTKVTDDPTMSNTCLNRYHKCCRYRCRRHRHLRRFRHHYLRSKKHQNCQKESIDIELKHLFNNSNSNNSTARSNQSATKAHRKLFFSNELNREDNLGRRQRIINYSSSSSSSSNYDDDDESDQENLSSSSEKAFKKHNFANDYKLKIETEASVAKQERDQQQDSHLTSSDETVDDQELDEDDDNDDGDGDDYGTKCDTTQNELPLNNRNNGMLPSFNSIYDEHLVDQNVDLNSKPILASDVRVITTPEALQIENCDDVNSSSLCSNNNNLSLSKPHNLASNFNNNNNNDTEELEKCNPHIEYRTGIRTVVDSNSSNSRIQEFKEWHQVLQLHSYNNEPLIVLPYVVLE